MSDDLEKRVREWLDDEGYPLEMETAQLLHLQGFHVSQSDYYETKEGKQREIDVVAWRTLKVMDDKRHDVAASVEFQIIVECKSSPIAKRPLIVFTSTVGNADKHHLVEDRPGSELTRGILLALSDDDDVMALDLFRCPTRLGYSIEEGPTHLDDPPPDKKRQTTT